MNDLFALAERALLAGDDEHARALLVSLVAVNPQHDTAWLLLARLTADPQKKEECYARAVAINPQNRAFIVEMTPVDGSTLTAPVTTLAAAPLAAESDWHEAHEAFAQAKQAFLLALVATGRRPEDSVTYRELDNVEQNWTKPTDAYSAALELYDQALRLIPGSHSFIEERKTIALKLERLLKTSVALPAPVSAKTQIKDQSLRQAETFARRLYAAYGNRLTEAQQTELLASGRQMLDDLDAAQTLDPRVTRARVTTSLIFISALELLLDLTNQGLAGCANPDECLRLAEDRARTLDYLHRLEQAENQARGESATAADPAKLQMILNALRARQSGVSGEGTAQGATLRVNELLEFADALGRILSEDDQSVQTVSLGQRVLQIVEEAAQADSERVAKWVHGPGRPALHKYERALLRELSANHLDESRRQELHDQQKRLATLVN